MSTAAARGKAVSTVTAVSAYTVEHTQDDRRMTMQISGENALNTAKWATNQLCT